MAVRCAEYPHVCWGKPTDDIFHQWEGAHIWVIDNNDFTKSQIAIYWDKLSYREKEKALRFHFERDRIRYVLTHGILRELLGKYLDCEEQSLFFRKNKFGKPFLKTFRNIEFNISHSGDLILLAFRFLENESNLVQIGIDVEKIKLDFDFELVLDSFFTLAEKNEIWKSENSTETFFKFWTRKEALVKATATGLTNELKQFDISQDRNNLKIEEWESSKFLSNQFYIYTFNMNSQNISKERNYMASIALMESDVRLDFFKYK